MSTTINLTNVIAAKGYGGADLVAIYGQNDAVIWEADNEPADPALTPEYYGKSQNYDFSQDYFNILPLANGKITFELVNNNQNCILYNNTGSDNDTWSVVPLQDEGVGSVSALHLWSMRVKKLKPIYLKVTSDYVFYGAKNSDEPVQLNRIKDATCNLYVRGYMDMSFAPAGKNMAFKEFFNGNTKLIGAKYLAVYRPDSGYNYENHVCREMFKNCINLLTAPALPTTSLIGKCYLGMFTGCTSLTTAPSLPATTLNQYCYANMFTGCTSLTAAPVLPATTAGNYCYFEMFKNCTSLTQAPALPATNFASNCYNGMFSGCTITTSPILPGLAPGVSSYKNMFNGCNNLNYITMYATNISGYNCMADWVKNVAATGIFVKNFNATWTTTGNSGVPTGWTVIYYDSTADKYYLSDKTTECDDHGNPLAHNYANDPFTIVAKSDGDINIEIGVYYTDGESESGSGSGDGESPSVIEVQYEVQYSTDGGTTWDLGYVMFGDEMTFTVQAGDEIMLMNDSVMVASDPNNYDLQNPIQISQSTTASFELQGNIMSLIYGEYFDGETSLTYGNHDFRFQQMFYNCTRLTSAENLVMPATTLTSTCYNLMFSGCTALTKSPVLPATTLTYGCYNGMFNGCTSLTHITMLATDISANQCLYNWVDGVAATGIFVKNASMNSLTTGASGIPSGWTVQDAT